MKKYLGGLTAFFLLLGVILYLESLQSDTSSKNAQIDNLTVAGTTSQEVVSQSNSTYEDSTSNDTAVFPIETVVKKESLLIGKTDSNPSQSLERLKAIAKKLDDIKISKLESLALNRDLSGDERFMSVYLISLHPTELKQPSLVNIASQPLPDFDGISRIRDDEVMVRMQAIEGMKNLSSKLKQKSLATILRHQESIFLSRFAKQSLRD